MSPLNEYPLMTVLFMSWSLFKGLIVWSVVRYIRTWSMWFVYILVKVCPPWSHRYLSLLVLYPRICGWCIGLLTQHICIWVNKFFCCQRIDFQPWRNKQRTLIHFYRIQNVTSPWRLHLWHHHRLLSCQRQQTRLPLVWYSCHGDQFGSDEILSCFGKELKSRC